MSGSLNKVMLIGRLTRDPELRFTPSGTAVCNLSIATNRYTRGDDGERQEHTDYHDIVVWNQGKRTLAESTAQYLTKGRMVYIEGRLQTRSWEDKDTGAKRYKTEINANDVQFLDSKGTDAQSQAAAKGYTSPTPVGSGPKDDIDPDDIPF